jgi:hypothetical protein
MCAARALNSSNNDVQVSVDTLDVDSLGSKQLRSLNSTLIYAKTAKTLCVPLHCYCKR